MGGDYAKYEIQNGKITSPKLAPMRKSSTDTAATGWSAPDDYDDLCCSDNDNDSCNYNDNNDNLVQEQELKLTMKSSQETVDTMSMTSDLTCDLSIPNQQQPPPQPSSSPQTTTVTDISKLSSAQLAQVIQDVYAVHPDRRKMELRRKRRVTHSAIGGAVVGGLLGGPIGAVVGGYGGAAATRRVCKQAEKKAQQAVEQANFQRAATDPSRQIHAACFA
jgi:hypothetical protein